MTTEILDALGELRSELSSFRSDVESRFEGVDRHLRGLEAELRLTRSQFETNGVAVARIEKRCAERGRALADLGAEVRGTPVPEEAELEDLDDEGDRDTDEVLVAAELLEEGGSR